MNTTDKLAEALRRCEQVIREACEEDPGKWDWAAINADEGAQAREALAAHEQAQAAPLKERPDFIAGYYAGLADGRRCAERDAAERAKAGEPVVPYLYVYEYDSPFGLNREFYPSGWNGQKPTRTVPLYTTPQPALAQRREPLTASQVNELCNECHLDWHRGWSLDEEPNRYLELARAIEKHHGIGATTGKEPGNV